LVVEPFEGGKMTNVISEMLGSARQFVKLRKVMNRQASKDEIRSFLNELAGAIAKCKML